MDSTYEGLKHQLRQIHGVSIQIVSQQQIGDLYVVHVRARTRDGREDEDIGVVSVAGLKGDDLVNALMKAITKAKRRVTLSVCGLGWLDETEVETIPGAERVGAGQVVAALQDALAAHETPALAQNGSHPNGPASVLERLTDKQRAYYTALCQKFGIDPAALVAARNITQPEGVSVLIDLLRSGDKPFRNPDQASRILTAICDRFGVPVSEAAQMLESQFGWDGDLATLVRGWTLWLEAALYEQSQASDDGDDDDDDGGDTSDPGDLIP